MVGLATAPIQYCTVAGAGQQQQDVLSLMSPVHHCGSFPQMSSKVCSNRFHKTDLLLTWIGMVMHVLKSHVSVQDPNSRRIFLP